MLHFLSFPRTRDDACVERPQGGPKGERSESSRRGEAPCCCRSFSLLPLGSPLAAPSSERAQRVGAPRWRAESSSGHGWPVGDDPEHRAMRWAPAQRGRPQGCAFSWLLLFAQAKRSESRLSAKTKTKSGNARSRQDQQHGAHASSGSLAALALRAFDASIVSLSREVIPLKE